MHLKKLSLRRRSVEAVAGVSIKSFGAPPSKRNDSHLRYELTRLRIWLLRLGCGATTSGDALHQLVRDHAN